MKSFVWWIRDRLEPPFWRLAIWLIETGYGKACKDFDWECACCQAGEIVGWIKEHIDLIEN